MEMNINCLNKDTFLNKNNDLEFSPAFIKNILDEAADSSRKTYTTKELKVELGI